MYRSNNRIFPMILIAVVVIALVAGLVTVGRYLIGGSGQRAEEAKSEQQMAREQLLSTGNDRSVRMTIRGPIVADEEHRSYRIAVSPSSRTYTMYRGYLESELVNKPYDNNTKAYEQFVYALDKAALTTPSKNSEQQVDDLRGICASGKVYEFEVLAANDVKQHYWTSTCKGSPGTLGASVQQVGGLFRSQIPERDIDLGTARTQLSF